MNDLNLKNIAEIVVNNIINKIISLTISRSLGIKTENEVPYICYEYVKDTMNNILSSFYMLYDKDEPRNGNITDINNQNGKSLFKSDIENIQKIILNKEYNNSNNNNNTNFLEKTGDETDVIFKNYFFNNIYKGDNDWDLIEEPSSLSLDRYSSTLITFKQKNKDLDGGKYKMNQGGILEEDENENEENNKTNQDNKTKNDKEMSKEKEKEKEIFKINVYKKKSNQQIIQSKKQLNEIANQFECFDLEPEESNEVLENIQIKKLREQFEKSKKNKEFEQKIIHEEKVKLINIQKINEEISRKYIGKKITKDHNGQIIFIKRIKPEKFKQDFVFGKTKFKTIANESQKKKIFKKVDIKNVEKNVQENIDEKNTEEGIRKKTSKKTNIRSLPKLNKLPMATIEEQDKNDDKKAISLKKRFPIITSGSNFNLMNMEIGVSLKEDEKYKTGGLDFLSKFKKFSLKAYDKKLKEAEAANSLKKNIEFIEEPKSQTIEEINNFYPTNYTMGYSTSYGNNNFSSTQTEPNNFMNRNMKLNNRMYSTNNSSMFNQYLKNMNYSNFKDNNQKNNTFNPFIQLSMGSSSLIGSLDKLNLVPNEEEKNLKKRRNIFRESKKNLLRKEKQIFLDEVNNFTKNLMTNKKVELPGDEKMKTISGIRNPEKPNMREIIQEIGLKGKIMRNRSKILAPIKSNFLDTENFFKQ
jgi:hypothetical protein